MLNKEYYAQKLIAVFPAAKEVYDKHLEDYGELLGHVFFADVINEPLIGLLASNTDTAAIGEYIGFLEDMYANGDEAVKNIVVVSVLERLGDDTTVLRNAYGYFSEQLRQASRDIEAFWGRQHNF